MTHADTYEEYLSDAPDLPIRPRRKLVTPTTIALLLIFVAALGFAGGILVQRGQGTSTSNSAATTGFPPGRTGATGNAFTRGGGAGGGTTIGTVSTVSGKKLYVSTVAGGTVEVEVTGVSKITKSKPAKVRAIHPGDSVVVSGITASKTGVVTASTISDSGTGGATSPFGGLGAAPTTGNGTTGTSGGGTSSTNLFGN